MTIKQRYHPIRYKPLAAHPAAEPLNVVDRAMRSVDRALRWLGYPGFDTQLLLWLSGRLDTSLLRESLNRLAALEPLITCRLSEERGGDPAWLANGSQVGLIETSLDTDSAEAIHAFAAEQLATPADPLARRPIRFNLIHRPAAPDVFLIQYNHTLTDSRGSLGIVQQINQLARTDSPELLQFGRQADDPIRRYLLRYPLKRRRVAVQRAIDAWWRAIKGGAATIGRPQNSCAQQRFRIRSITMTKEQTLALRARTIAACGFPAISMSVLAAVFRALNQQGAVRNHNHSWVAGIGVDLGLRRPGVSVLHNQMSILPVRIESSELGSRQRAIQLLNEQLRDQLASEVDLGLLQLMRVLARRPHQMDWAVDHCLAHGFSLWYAYFGSLDEIGREFLGVPIENASYIGPCWSPIGVTLLAQEFQGRLGLQLTYLPELVSDEDANRFLARTCADL
jgi:hypothetical protein